MDLDERLLAALGSYGKRRRSIGRAFARGVAGCYHGGQDMLLWVDRLEQPNITALANALGITRGGTSRGVAKLEAAGLVESYQLPENRKEVYLRLTAPGGATVARLREKMDSLHAREMAYLATLSAGQKKIVLDFFNGITLQLSAWEEEMASREDTHGQNA